MKRMAQAVLFTALLAAVALGLPAEAEAQPYSWSKVTVDSVGDVEWDLHTSIAVDGNGDPMVSYRDDTSDDLRFAICDMSASANGNCDQPGDWSSVTVDSAGDVGYDTSIAVDANGDPVISYLDSTNSELKFAICDLSESANGNCDQTGDWITATVDDPEEGMGWATGIAVDPNGDPVISYRDGGLKFAICDMSASANDNCDQTADWSTVTVDSTGGLLGVGGWSSIAVDANGDPVISYCDLDNEDLKFAICDLSASANGNCDQTADWSTVTVAGAGESAGWFTSIAVDLNGDPVISHFASATLYDLEFSICDISESVNGNCDQTGDWSTETVDAAGNVGPYTSIAVDVNGDPMISYRDDTNENLKFAICDMSESVNGNCDQTGDWSTETVDAVGDVGEWTAIAVDASGYPMISYGDDTNDDLKFAIGWSPPSGPVGGIAELPDVSESAGRNYIAVAGLAAAALIALSAGAWYARKRWMR